MNDQSMFYGADGDFLNGSYYPNNNITNPNHNGYDVRSSQVHTNCDCVRRNGLQDNCPRTLCQKKSMNPSPANFGSQFYPSPMDGMSSIDGMAMAVGSGVQCNETHPNALQQQPDLTPYNRNQYDWYQNAVRSQVPTYPNGGNWDDDSQQRNYPCYG